MAGGCGGVVAWDVVLWRAAARLGAMKILATTSLALGLVLAANAALPAQSEGVEVGSTPAYEFRQPILNGMGAKSLADLKGKPTLIDFWGTR